MNRLKKYTGWVAAFIFGVALIAVYKTFDNIQNVFSFLGDVIKAMAPFLIGFIIAYVLDRPCRKIEGLYSDSKLGFIRKKSRGLSILSVYLIFVIALAVVIRMIIPALYTNIIDLYNNIIPLTQSAAEKIDSFQKSLGISIIEINEETAKSAIQSVLNSVNIGKIGNYAKGAISFTSGLLNAFIAIIISVYMLIDREKLIGVYRRVLAVIVPPDKIGRVQRYTERINAIFSNYVYSCVIDAMIVAVLATIILSIIGVKYAIIFGTFIGLCNLIPYFGAIFSNVITVIITIFSGGWLKAVWVAASLFVLGQIDGNFIGPRIMGDKLEVRPIWIIFAVTVGGGLFGVAGMLLSVPAMMVIRMLLSELISNIEEKREMQTGRQE